MIGMLLSRQLTESSALYYGM